MSADDHAGSVHRVQGTRLVDDIWAEELHNLGQPEAFRDFMQPRARLEDVLYAHLALLLTVPGIASRLLRGVHGSLTPRVGRSSISNWRKLEVAGLAARP